MAVTAAGLPAVLLRLKAATVSPGAAAKTWKQWKLPGTRPQTYAVYVDPDDKVWLSDWGSNAIVRFDPKTEKFESFPSDKTAANVRQLAGRPGEVWGGQSGTRRLVAVRY